MFVPASSTIKNFQTLKTAVLWAGWLSVAQALIWMGLTITGIIAYNCILYITEYLSMGTMVKTVFFDVYFHGPCRMSTNDYQNYNYTMLDTVPRVLDPTQLLIWDCVYLGVAACWLIAAVVLLTYVSKDNAKQTLGVIYTWTFFTLSICCMDVALGVIFGVDYTRFEDAALKYNANDINAGVIDANAVQLIAGAVAAMSMMIISFKGFVLWIINFGLVIYLCVLATRIYTDKDGTDTLFMPRKDSNDILSTRPPPIRAYEEEKVVVNGFSNEAYVPDNRSLETIEINEEAIVRAGHMSRDSNYMDRRFRSLDAFQQYPAPSGPQSGRSVHPATQETVIVASSGFPIVDYTPQTSPNGGPRQYKY